MPFLGDLLDFLVLLFGRTNFNKSRADSLLCSWFNLVRVSSCVAKGRDFDNPTLSGAIPIRRFENVSL